MKMNKKKTRDVFICYASEDKSEIVERLVSALKDSGISFWYDNADIQWGDSITEKVNEGLRISRYVIVVLSPNFMNKPWPQRELYSVLNLEASTGDVRILPLLCGNSAERKKILEALPLLNDKFYITWSDEPNVITSVLRQRLLASERSGFDRILLTESQSTPIKQTQCATVSKVVSAQSVSLYLLGHDYLRIGWLFLAVGVGGVFAMPAFIGYKISIRILFCIGLLVIPSVWIGVFLMLTGKYYNEAGHKYPSLNLGLRRTTVLFPFGAKWKQTWTIAKEYAELRLATLFYTFAFFVGCFLLIGAVCTIMLIIPLLR